MAKRKVFELGISYPGERYPELDAVLRKRIGKREHSSGMGMGERDMQFTFKTYEEARAAQVKALRFKGVTSFIDGGE